MRDNYRYQSRVKIINMSWFGDESNCLQSGKGLFGESTRSRTTKSRLRVLAAQFARVLRRSSPSVEQRAQGRPGGRCTRGLRAKGICAKRVDHRYRRGQPAFPARWFTTYCALFPVNLAVCHRPSRSSRFTWVEAPAFGAPEPHAFAVRARDRSSHGPFASTASPHHVRDDAYAPCAGAECGN